MLCQEKSYGVTSSYWVRGQFVWSLVFVEEGRNRPRGGSL